MASWEANLEMDGEKIINNGLLCFVVSALEEYSQNELIGLVNSFYTQEDIKESKTILSKLLGRDMKTRRDKIKDVSDLMELCSDLPNNDTINCKFVTDTFKNIPPINVESVLPVFHNLSKELFMCNEQLNDLKTINNSFASDLVSNLKQDLSCLKSEIAKLNTEKRELQSELDRYKSNNSSMSETIFCEDTFIIKKQLQEMKCMMTYMNNNIGKINKITNLSISDDDDVFSNSIGDFLNQKNEADTDLKSYLENGSKRNNVPVINSQKNFDDEFPKPNNITSLSPSAPPLSQPDEYWGVATKSPNLYKTNIETPETLDQKKPESELYSDKLKSMIKFNNDNRSTNEVFKPRPDNRNQINDGFTTYYSRKKKKEIMTGTRKSANFKLKSAVKTTDLYVGRCDAHITPKDIKDYLSEELKVIALKCEDINTKIPFSKAFKLTININDCNALLNSECWPEGIVCRKYFYKNLK